MSLTQQSISPSPLALMSPCSVSQTIKSANTPTQANFFVFGGYLPNGDDSNALLQYSTSQNQWQTLHKGGTNAPKARSSGSLIFRKSSLILYGGMECNDFWEFSLSSKSWQQIKCDGLPAETRANHTAVYLKRLDTMLIYGGTLNSDEMSNGFLHLFNFAESKWSKFKPKERPTNERLDHTAVLWKDAKMIVFGGMDENDQSLNDVWSLSCAPHKWSPIGMNLKWSKVECTGQIPEARSRHAATIVDSRMFIFGGSSADGQCLNDLYMLELNSNVWQRLEILQPLLGRNGHVMHAIEMPKPEDSDEEDGESDENDSSDDDVEEKGEEDDDEDPLPAIFILCGNDKDFKVLDQADMVRQATFKEIMDITNPQKEAMEVFNGFNYSLQIEYGMMRKKLECKRVMSLDSLKAQVAVTLGLKADECQFQWKNDQGKWGQLVNPRPDLDSIGKKVLGALPSTVVVKVEDK